MRTRRRLATPFVATLVVACSRGAETPSVGPEEPPPKPRASSSATTSESAKPDDAPIVYDGFGSCYRLVDGEKKYVPKCPESLLPEAPTDRLVYAYAGYCRRVPDGRPVRCPETGPTGILPEPSSKKHGDGSIFLQYGTLRCFQGHDVKCPPGVACNPPPPTAVDCPPELLPRLSGGASPTKTSGGRCWFGDVEVACPKP